MKLFKLRMYFADSLKKRAIVCNSSLRQDKPGKSLLSINIVSTLSRSYFVFYEENKYLFFLYCVDILQAFSQIDERFIINVIL